MALGLIQAVRERSTKNILGSKGRSAPEADNFTAINEAIVKMM
jgi:hypothetical protein